MKKTLFPANKFIWFSLLICALMVNCKKNLTETPYSFLGEADSYKTAADAVTAVNAVYDRLRTFYGMPMLLLSDLNADDMTIRADGGASSVELDQNTYTAANGTFDGLYTNTY